MTLEDKFRQGSEEVPKKGLLPLECLGYQRSPHYYEGLPAKKGTFEPYCPDCKEIKQFDEED